MSARKARSVRGPVTVSGAGRFVLATGMTFTNAVTATTISPGAVTGLIMVNDNTNGIVTTVSGPLTFNATAANGNDFYGPLDFGLAEYHRPHHECCDGRASASRDGFVRFSGGGDYFPVRPKPGHHVHWREQRHFNTNSVLTQSASGPAVFDLNGFNQTLAGLSDGGVESGSHH